MIDFLGILITCLIVALIAWIMVFLLIKDSKNTPTSTDPVVPPIRKDTGFRLHGRRLFTYDLIYHIPSKTWVIVSPIRPGVGFPWADPEGIAKDPQNYLWENYCGWESS